ncbi:MAG: hypothetical protein LBC28_01790 [Oscillospiraceae bacterium]|jgi:hypothetical protein|nr:hypothetical protein [Oscillospiraceae bacterium]
MNNTGEASGLESFDGVWERVTAQPTAAAAPLTVLTPDPAQATTAAGGAASASAETEAARLRGVMELITAEEREAGAAARLGGSVRAVALSIARSCRASLRELGTQYYILTGECYFPCASSVPARPVCEALRRVCTLQSSVRETCLASSSATAVPSLESAFARAAQSCVCRTRAAERLLGALIQR